MTNDQTLFEDSGLPPIGERVVKTAQLSDDGLYRYELTRQWAAHDAFVQRLMTLIMLNPSTADADIDDPTIRRCMTFARREGWHGIRVVNLYAWRATDPADLVAVAARHAAVGPENDKHIKRAIARAYNTVTPVVCAWGASATRLPDFEQRVAFVQAVASEWHVTLRCLGVTADGHPRHPLYLRGDAPLLDWPSGAVSQPKTSRRG